MRILLAEDEIALSKAIVKILEHHGYMVDAVFDGEEAIKYVTTGNYDVAIFDIMMPKMDGLSALEKIRASGNLIPILVLSARSQINDKVTGLDLGANDYLTKPFSTKELLARLRAMSRNQSGLSNTTLKAGNITLNRTTFELSSPSGTFRLSNKEFQMMELFMCSFNQKITTERLMEKIWGYESNSDIQVVWVYICYLRKKLSLLEANIKIKNEKNHGYSLEYVNDQKA